MWKEKYSIGVEIIDEQHKELFKNLGEFIRIVQEKEVDWEKRLDKAKETLECMEMDEIDVFVTSALGEIANIIGGSAITYLSKHDYNCDITPPQIIIGQHQSISMAANKKPLVIPIKTRIGEFNIAIFLTEN